MHSFFLTYSSFFEGGNFTETYQFSLNIICFSGFINLYTSKNFQSKTGFKILCFFLGLAISSGLLMRPNNIAGLLILSFFFMYVLNKKLLNLVFILIGALIPFMVLFLFFSEKEIIRFF